MRPTSRSASVDKVDVDLDAITSGRGTHDRADALRGATTPADHTTEIARADLDLELQTVPALDSIDPYGVGIVDDRTHDMGEHSRRRRRRNLVEREAGSTESG